MELFIFVLFNALESIHLWLISQVTNLTFQILQLVDVTLDWTFKNAFEKKKINIGLKVSRCTRTGYSDINCVCGMLGDQYSDINICGIFRYQLCLWDGGNLMQLQLRPQCQLSPQLIVSQRVSQLLKVPVKSGRYKYKYMWKVTVYRCNFSRPTAEIISGDNDLWNVADYRCRQLIAQPPRFLQVDKNWQIAC